MTAWKEDLHDSLLHKWKHMSSASTKNIRVCGKSLCKPYMLFKWMEAEGIEILLFQVIIQDLFQQSFLFNN